MITTWGFGGGQTTSIWGWGGQDVLLPAQDQPYRPALVDVFELTPQLVDSDRVPRAPQIGSTLRLRPTLTSDVLPSPTVTATPMRPRLGVSTADPPAPQLVSGTNLRPSLAADGLRPSLSVDSQCEPEIIAVTPLTPDVTADKDDES